MKKYTKIIEWLFRYGPAEGSAIMCAIIGGMTFHYVFQNSIVTAFGATWSENIGYYSPIIYSDIKNRKNKYGVVNARGMLAVVRNLLIEFGPSEYLDSFLIRPVTMYMFSQISGNLVFGLFLGKISADIIFYIPTIISYEFRKRIFKD